MAKNNKLLIKYVRAKFFILSRISKKKAAKEAFDLFCTPIPNEIPNHPALPSSNEVLQFRLNGLLVKGYRWNKGGKERLLILHGFSSSASNFYHLVSEFIKNDFEVLAFDAPAHGSSEGKNINVIVYAEMIKKILDLYGPVQNYVAHSFGGLAVCIALEEISHPKTTRVVLLAPATETTSAIDGAFKLLRINNPTVRKEFDNLILKLSGRPAEWYSIKRAIKNIKAKVLWIHDEGDNITPIIDAKNALIESPENVKFLVTTGLGHRKIYKDKDVVNTVISFL